MRAAVLVGLALCLGCKAKPRASGDGPSLALPTETVVDEGIIEGPGEWRGGGTLRLALPEGWAWRSLPPGAGLVLDARHPATGIQLQIWSYAPSFPTAPRPRSGCEWMFTDVASHRRVPLLAPALTATCLADDATGPTLQGWYGLHRDREVHVEVLYPAGRIVEGRQIVESLLLHLESDD